MMQNPGEIWFKWETKSMPAHDVQIALSCKFQESVMSIVNFAPNLSFINHGCDEKFLYETTEDSIIGPSSPSMVWIIYDSTASEENRFQINIFLGMHTLMTWNLKVLLNIKTGSSKLTFIMLIYHQILHEILGFITHSSTAKNPWEIAGSMLV